MKRSIFITGIAIGLLCCALAGAGTYRGGTNDPCSEKEFTDPCDRQECVIDSNGRLDNFIFATDINLFGQILAPIGNCPNSFADAFDNADNMVPNVIINMPRNVYADLFSFADSNGEIRNIGVKDVNIIGEIVFGGLVWHNQGTNSEYYSTGSANSHISDGGAAGYNYFESKIFNNFDMEPPTVNMEKR